MSARLEPSGRKKSRQEPSGKGRGGARGCKGQTRSLHGRQRDASGKSENRGAWGLRPSSLWLLASAPVVTWRSCGHGGLRAQHSPRKLCPPPGPPARARSLSREQTHETFFKKSKNKAKWERGSLACDKVSPGRWRPGQHDVRNRVVVRRRSVPPCFPGSNPTGSKGARSSRGWSSSQTTVSRGKAGRILANSERNPSWR